MHKKKALLCLLFAPLLYLTGCRAQPVSQPATDIRIGVTVYNQDTFISEMMEELLELAQQKEQESGVPITIIRESADGNQEAQNNQVESLIDAGCDVLCVNLVDRTDVSVIVDKAEAAGLPIVFFNRELVGEDLKRNDQLFYVGAKALESGRMQGEIIVDICHANFDRVDKNGDGVIQYAMLEGEAGHQDAVMRTEYSIKTLTEAGYKVERLEDEIANWVRSQAETKMSQWLTVHGGSIEVVFANNDDMALGAIDALKRASIPSADWPLVVGIDGTRAGLTAVSTGEMVGTVLNDAKGQAQGVLDLSYALSAGEPLPPLQDEKYIRLPYQVVTIENVLEYMKP